jgi:hypothetical protein
LCPRLHFSHGITDDALIADLVFFAAMELAGDPPPQGPNALASSEKPAAAMNLVADPPTDNPDASASSTESAAAMDNAGGSASKSLQTLPDPATRTPAETPFRFLDLPAELRVQIYEYLVVVGKVFFTPDWYDVQEGKIRFKDWTKYPIPSLQLLRACKQIHEEAEEVYFGKNLFGLLYALHEIVPFRLHTLSAYVQHPLGRGRPLFSQRGLQLI